MLFLAAAMNKNRLPNSPAILKQLIKATTDIDLQALKNAGVIEFIRGRKPASKTLAECYWQSETELETETETEKSTYTAPTARRARRPAKRNPLDQSLTDLIDYFKNHDARKSRYVPKWDRDKKLLRPYVLEKGHSRVREMLDAFILREKWEYAGDDFARNFILNQPLSIQGFVACSDRLDNVLDWDTEEKPYGEGNQKKDDEAGPTLL
jgi:hypothetical protein